MAAYIDAIRNLERESNALHREVHRTFRLRDESKHKLKDWKRAAERFRTYRSDLDPLIDRCRPSAGEVTELYLREFMFDYVEVDPQFYRSGYILEKVLARIKKLKLTADEMFKVQTLLLNRIRTKALRNFRHICRVIPMIENRQLRETVAELAASDDPSIRRRAEFALAYFRK
ncbi:MAG: hypothetical protein JNK34_08350 [Tabrizicola sp.]|nr:hypothetical protein [Tabrizicola sp.]